MHETVNTEDKVKLVGYTAFWLLLTVVLMLVIAWFMGTEQILGAFLAITGLWFSVKFMCRYGKKIVVSEPVCILGTSEIEIYSLPGKTVKMNYRDISSAKIIRNATSVKLFLSGDKVTHPSGYYYVGVVYPFRRNDLDRVEQEITTRLNKHKIKAEKVSKA